MIEPGTLLQNRYRVVKQIGQGGMGAVYFATDERFNSAVAVKQTFFDDPALRKAFEREAHLLNHLRHTALPKVSDHFTEGDGQFLVMEYIEGSDISALQQQRAGAFPLADVLRWADELLDALDYLHTHEPPVVHRDIKPQNLKLTSRGQIVLLDFGLAKGTSSQARAHVTASVFGYSRSYAPLEQIQGTGTDARSDLYSLGATLYHLLTGAAPVDALTRASAIVNGQPDPLRPAHHAHVQVPVSISEIIRRSMAQNAAHRHSTAAEMRAVLRRAANALPHHFPSVRVSAPGQSALDIATVLESTPQATSGQQAHTDMLSLTQVRPQLAASDGETTFVDAFGVSRRQPLTPAVVPAHTESAHKSPAKLIGVALAVLVACVLVAFPLMRRRGEALPGNSEAHAETTSGAPVDAGSAAPDTSQVEAGSENSNSSSAAEATPSPTPSPVAAGEAPTSNGQPATGNAATTSGSDLKNGSNADESKSGPFPVGATAGSSGLLVQSPTSNAQSGNHSAAAEYDAQRAEALRRKKEQQEQELRQRRLDEQNQYGEPVQHYELERRGPPPPPPGGGGPPPPPPPPPP